jgi:hypothetical protein
MQSKMDAGIGFAAKDYLTRRNRKVSAKLNNRNAIE